MLGIKACVLQLSHNRSSRVFSPVIINGNNVHFKVCHACFCKQFQSLSWIVFSRWHICPSRVHRTDVLVARNRTTVGIAQFEANSWINCHCNCAAYAFVRVRHFAVNFGQLVWTDNDRCSRCNFRAFPAKTFNDVNKVTNSFIEHVNFVSSSCGNPSGWIGAVVDVFDTVHIGAFTSGVTPPVVAFVAYKHSFDANFE